MSTRPPGWLADQLPLVMQQDDFTNRFLGIFEEVADTLVHSVDTIAVSADLSLAPQTFVPWLGSWIAAPAVDSHRPDEVGERNWVRAHAHALTARGTKVGLQRVLQELAGGHPVEIEDGGGVYREGAGPEGDSAWVRVRMPLADQTEPQEVVDLIRAEVPLGVAVELEVLPLLPRPREPLEDAHEPETWQPVPGGPYFWDGGTGDVYPPLRDEPGHEPESEPLSGAVRRLPGTGGRAVRPGRICPGCAEPNDFAASACLRCDSLMHLPPPEPVSEPEPEVLPLWSEEADWLAEPRIQPEFLWALALVTFLAVVVATLILFG